MSRGSYVDMSEERSSAHNGEVVGVACDSTNSLMISAGYNGDIKVYTFKFMMHNCLILKGGIYVKLCL